MILFILLTLAAIVFAGIVLTLLQMEENRRHRIMAGMFNKRLRQLEWPKEAGRTENFK